MGGRSVHVVQTPAVNEVVHIQTEHDDLQRQVKSK